MLRFKDDKEKKGNFKRKRSARPRKHKNRERDVNKRPSCVHIKCVFVYVCSHYEYSLGLSKSVLHV